MTCFKSIKQPPPPKKKNNTFGTVYAESLSKNSPNWISEHITLHNNSCFFLLRANLKNVYNAMAECPNLFFFFFFLMLFSDVSRLLSTCDFLHSFMLIPVMFLINI